MKPIAHCFAACAALFVAIIALPDPAKADPPSPVAAAHAAVVLFGQTCAANLGRPQATETAIKAAGFGIAPKPVSDRLLNGKPGQVWVPPEADSRVTVLMQPNASACQVYTGWGTIPALQSDFREMVESAQGEGLKVQKEQDEDVETDGMRLHLIRFRLSLIGPRTQQLDRVLTLATNAAPNALVVGAMTAILAADAPAGGATAAR
jgi:hypothetical protein